MNINQQTQTNVKIHTRYNILGIPYLNKLVYIFKIYKGELK